MTVSLYTAAQARELDRLTIEQGKVPGYLLMCRAGRFSFSQIQNYWPACRSLLVLCGKGNNGGDGYVIAKLAHQAGMQVRLFSSCDPQTLTGDALLAYQDCGVEVEVGVDQLPLDAADVLVDALLGTGAQGAVRGVCQTWIEQINAVGKAVLSVDLPSGLGADTGQVLGCAVKATVTACFIGRKRGLYTGQARAYVGAIVFSDLSVRSGIYEQVPSAVSLLDQSSHTKLPKRLATSYKTSHGHVFVVGGDVGTFGAVLLSAQACARAGAGLVSVYTPPEHGLWVTMAQPELMLVRDNWPLASVLVVGPGLGQAKFGQQAWAYALAQHKPMVVDADGLNLLAQQYLQPPKRDNWILTPHPGEAARLLGCSVEEVEQDRFAAVQALQQRYGGAVMLKGAGTLIADRHGHVSVLGVGNAGMASGGMGDVLAGVCGALLAQGLSVDEAAAYGAWLHSSAADTAAEGGQRGMLASDLLPLIRRFLG
ncbi:MAG TPA: bifunctional ADP-dependent NAD(P)H-hydrate dehydratase/NAD(P)H-hydrate epimerase [Oceanospirillaceae bacterium]|nr:bifunctional ADP-dependent NAD(P)H-hydrate dehydratase/NAD(P)H-hydrate epimerase [Oceanospirillaceae bacterium]